MDAPRSVDETELIMRELLDRTDGSPAPTAATLCLPRLVNAGLLIVLERESKRISAHRTLARQVIGCNQSQVDPSFMTLAMKYDEARRFTGPFEQPAHHLAEGANKAGACLIFKFGTPDEARAALTLIGEAFRLLQLAQGAEHPYEYNICIGVGLQEADRNGYVFCPCNKEIFKARAHRERRLHFSITQTSEQPMGLESIRRVGISMMTPWSGFETGEGHYWLDIVSTEWLGSKALTLVVQWPLDLNFDAAKNDEVVMLNVVLDTNFVGLAQPLRLTTGLKIRVTKATDRIWLQGKKEAQTQAFSVKLNMSKLPRPPFIPDYRCNSLYRSNLTAAKSEEDLSADPGNGEQSDNEADDEDGTAEADPSATDLVLVSGRGSVDQNMNDTQLTRWTSVIAKWDASSRKTINALARGGVPDRLRPQVWLRLAGVADSDLELSYPLLLKQESRAHEAIKWDLDRTFPGHERFRDKEGEGQKQLYRINSAYSVYDEEIGYVQGLSFITAVLLLHLPEESAFVLYVKMMQDYGLRDLYMTGFENLHLRLHQLDRLLLEALPDLYAHMKELRVETHMYASQWFLTLFATKFSLPLVYRIFDFFLAEGFQTIFQISLALLKASRKELLASTFEEIMAYFRTELPRRFQSEAEARRLISMANGIKVGARKLAKLEQEYLEQKAAEALAQDPVQVLTTENNRLQEENVKLQQELEVMSQKLVETQTQMQMKIEASEDALNSQLKEYENLSKASHEAKRNIELDSRNLEEEVRLVKELYRTTLAKTDEEKMALQKKLDEVQAQLQVKQRHLNEAEERVQTLEARVAAHSDDADSVELHARIQALELQLAEAKLQSVEKDCEIERLQNVTGERPSSKDTSASGGSGSKFRAPRLSMFGGKKNNAASSS
ncbi:uncharacterized protein MONBRDRAFT_22245 [Monosiga brevicollis MX1]|uniref:Rab-GAP TBC domain-containing protein n=1 Tax=Monosiga brevicollis TaxID=81824 RepID=A9UQ02_MONBE|nr:uncharacterized protein MONBRDRAFT_22245 [Monosiga brevicollis MX1]EDQ92963.1 predicted protein [Monosiga brevicollis MX1]|eukprot:XP_001742725.1 hypothetical protein [Monosiga brevicollis MX1]